MKQILTTELAELICTRISHDLIGSIGTVANALELWEDDSNDMTDVKMLLENSSQVLNARMKFFRLAFGLKNAAPKNLEEFDEIIRCYLETIGNAKTPIVLISDIKNVSCYKIAMLAVMLLADSFVRGGTIKAIETDDTLRFEATSEYDLSISKLEKMQQAVKGEIPNENPALFAHVAYLKAFLSEIGADIELAFEHKKAVLNIK